MDLKTALIVGGLAVLALILTNAPRLFWDRKQATKPSEIKKSKYRYYSRKYIMTSRENEFFHRLNTLVGRYWYIVPQVHLSAFLNHKIKGQNWSAAFRHINGKSVDYALISKKSGEVICIIELDDSTHDYDVRMERDAEINRILYEAGIPLARFRSVEHMKDREILNEIRDAIRKPE